MKLLIDHKINEMKLLIDCIVGESMVKYTKKVVISKTVKKLFNFWHK